MAATYTRLLDLQGLGPNFKQVKLDVVDVGPYNRVVLQVRVVKAGGAGNLIIQEAAVNEDDAFVNVAGGTVALSATSNTKVVIADPQRFLRATTDANVAGGPQALIDLIARE
jgi:hypothetical protein